MWLSLYSLLFPQCKIGTGSAGKSDRLQATKATTNNKAIDSENVTAMLFDTIFWRLTTVS